MTGAGGYRGPKEKRFGIEWTYYQRYARRLPRTWRTWYWTREARDNAFVDSPRVGSLGFLMIKVEK